MSKPTLFVCQSCNDAAHKRIKPSQGAQLLEQLNTLQTEDSPITIQPVNCLWMCSKACVVAISAPNQPTYLFTDLPPTESAEALLQFAKLHHQHNGESIPYRQFPEALKSGSVAKIPPVA
jgi:predicted metal-binding protein